MKTFIENIPSLGEVVCVKVKVTNKSFFKFKKILEQKGIDVNRDYKDVVLEVPLNDFMSKDDFEGYSPKLTSYLKEAVKLGAETFYIVNTSTKELLPDDIQNIIEKNSIEKLKNWDRVDLEGSYMENLDEYLKKYVRMGVSEARTYIILANKKELKKAISEFEHKKILKLLDKRKDNYDVDYLEYYAEELMPVVNKVLPLADIDTMYVNAFDFIIEEIDRINKI